MTMVELIDLWFERGAPTDISENTIHCYKGILHGNVAPVIGDRRVSELKSEHVEAMLDAMAEAGLAASTMRHALNLTRRVLKFGMRRDLVNRNVAEPVQTHRGPKAERYGLTVKQARRLLDAAAGDRLENLLIVALLLGLRPGEAAGLTWENVKTKGKPPTITIAASPRRTPLGALILVPPKTATSRRTLEIPPPVVDALKAQRALQKTELQAAGRAWRNTYDLVFTTDVGTPLDPSNVRRVYARLAKEADLGHLHPHMLRHAAASLLSAAGVPIEDIADTLGHSSISVTADIYRHPIAPVRSGHMAAMNQLIDTPPQNKKAKAQPRRRVVVAATCAFARTQSDAAASSGSQTSGIHASTVDRIHRARLPHLQNSGDLTPAPSVGTRNDVVRVRVRDGSGAGTHCCRRGPRNLSGIMCGFG